jgi:hypothetical protein
MNQQIVLKTTLTKNPKFETKMINLKAKTKLMMMHRQQQLKQVVSSLLKTWPSSPKQTEGPKSHNKCKKKRSFAPHSSLISPWAATASLKCKCSSVMLDRSSARNRPRSTLSQHSWTTSNTSLTQWLILWLHTSSWRLFCIRHRAVPSPSSRCSPMLATWKKLLLPNSKPSRLGCSKSCSNTVWSNNVSRICGGSLYLLGGTS